MICSDVRSDCAVVSVWCRRKNERRKISQLDWADIVQTPDGERQADDSCQCIRLPLTLKYLPVLRGGWLTSNPTLCREYRCRLHIAWGGAPWVKNSKQETKQTVLTITKVLTCTCRAKKAEGHEKKCLRYAPDVCPHFQIRSGATDGNHHSIQSCSQVNRVINIVYFAI